MRSFKKWAAAGLALSTVGILTGCAITKNGTSPAINVTKNTTGNHTGGTNNTTNTTNSTSHVNSTTSNRVTQNSPGTTTSSVSPHVTLENVQVSANSILLITTHGTMQTAYRDPQITNGTFTVTLVNMTLSPSILANKTYTSNGMSYRFNPNGENVVVTIQFSAPFPNTFQTGIAGGDMINFIFKSGS